MNNKRLALTKDGRMTYCTCNMDERGKGRCNHIAHQKDEESIDDFINRVNDINDIKVCGNDITNKVRDKFLENGTCNYSFDGKIMKNEFKLNNNSVKNEFKIDSDYKKFGYKNKNKMIKSIMIAFATISISCCIFLVDSIKVHSQDINVKQVKDIDSTDSEIYDITYNGCLITAEDLKDKAYVYDNGSLEQIKDTYTENIQDWLGIPKNEQISDDNIIITDSKDKSEYYSYYLISKNEIVLNADILDDGVYDDNTNKAFLHALVHELTHHEQCVNGTVDESKAASIDDAFNDVESYNDYIKDSSEVEADQNGVNYLEYITGEKQSISHEGRNYTSNSSQPINISN